MMCNLRTTKLLGCALIMVCAVIMSNTVSKIILKYHPILPLTSPLDGDVNYGATEIAYPHYSEALY